ncbi:hypothetical protein [Pedobacter ureilyticus]|jgi:membrane protein implicated in regulation of membrane protease activity|uniref:Uncharacterized protein n=1 Tax=Pedobacter ureilyticus TaxID=1393051 RepID=A0ABW9J7C5_9SPHI|nr:hypothetical protein [Pedobacter helvus]
MDAKEREQSIETANQPSIYMIILVGVAISVLGTFLRFAADALWLSLLSWAILAVGSVICCVGVFKILGSSKSQN